MANQTIKLTRTPVQITTGSNNGLIQSKNSRPFIIGHSATQPDPYSGGAVVNFIEIGPPWIMWAWSLSGEEVEVNIQST